jgi:hypothetical protein
MGMPAAPGLLVCPLLALGPTAADLNWEAAVGGLFAFVPFSHARKEHIANGEQNVYIRSSSSLGPDPSRRKG